MHGFASLSLACTTIARDTACRMTNRRFYCLFHSNLSPTANCSPTQSTHSALKVLFAQTDDEKKNCLSFHFILKFQMKFLFYIPFPFRFGILSFVINIYSIIWCVYICHCMHALTPILHAHPLFRNP